MAMALLNSKRATTLSLRVPGQVVISGPITDLILISDNGNIGAAPASGANPATNPNALQLALTGTTSVGALDQAVAQQGGIYVNQTAGDLIVGNITAGGAVQLAATGSIYAEFAIRRWLRAHHRWVARSARRRRNRL